MTGHATVTGARAGRPVTVLGSLNVDVVVRPSALPRPGETVLSPTVERLPGGKGANQAAALAALRVPVRVLGAVGRDPDGDLCLASLPGVDVTEVRRVADPTGLALVTVDASAENTVVVVAGANARAVAPDEVADLLVQLEVPLAAVRAAVERATGLVVLNAAPAQPLPDELLARVDVLVVNETEALTTSGAATVEAAVEALGRWVRRGVVVTLGARGALVHLADHDHPADHDPPPAPLDHPAGVAVAAPAVAAVDTVGAGDAFTAALVWRLREGDDLVAAATVACRAGAVAVTRLGARTGVTAADLG